MIFDLGYAEDILRVDGSDNDSIITPILKAIPGYIEHVTGYPASVTETGKASDLVNLYGSFLLQLWYNPDGTDSEQLTRTCESLARTIRTVQATGADV